MSFIYLIFSIVYLVIGIVTPINSFIFYASNVLFILFGISSIKAYNTFMQLVISVFCFILAFINIKNHNVFVTYSVCSLAFAIFSRISFWLEKKHDTIKNN